MKDHGQNPDKGIKSGAAPVSFNEVEKLTEAKYTIQKYKRILFYVVICVLLAAFLLGQYIYPSEREPVTEESITYTGTFYRVLADGTAKEVFAQEEALKKARLQKPYVMQLCEALGYEKSYLTVEELLKDQVS